MLFCVQRLPFGQMVVGMARVASLLMIITVGGGAAAAWGQRAGAAAAMGDSGLAV